MADSATYIRPSSLLAAVDRVLRYDFIKLSLRNLSPRVMRTLLGMTLFLLVGVTYHSSFGVKLESTLLHRWFVIRGTRVAPTAVCIVRVDRPTFDKLGLPDASKLPRRYLAQILPKIAAAGSKLTILDFFLETPGDSPEADQQLAAALAAAPSAIGRSVYTQSRVRQIFQRPRCIYRNFK